MSPRYPTTVILVLVFAAGCAEDGVECTASVELKGKQGSYTFRLKDESVLTNQRDNMETIAKAGACRAACSKVYPAGGDSAARKKREASLQRCQDRCREEGGAEVECGKVRMVTRERSSPAR